MSPAPVGGRRIRQNCRDAYAERVTSVAGQGPFRPLKIVANAGNGVAGPAFDSVLEKITDAGASITVHRIFFEPDGTFPNGVPNPILPQNHLATAQAVRNTGADFGVAWDGDFDRCFFFDDTGAFVNGEFIVALLAKATLAIAPRAVIVHDPRVSWNIQSAVVEAGGRAVQSKTGHVHMKSMMRQQNAAYGGELSGHHYFRDFMFCDSGMIPLATIVGMLGRDTATLSEMVADMRAAHPSSGEINFQVAYPQTLIEKVEAHFAAAARAVDRTDGVSMEFEDWRFNIRKSNTEPLLRLNVEARRRPDLVENAVRRISTLIQGSS